MQRLFHRHTFPHGVHPPECKHLTRDSRIRRLPFAPEMVIPLSQHTGAPAVALVHEGQEVVRGEPIARAGGFVSVPMHAPATGVIRKIGLAPSPRGTMVDSIYLKLYPGASQEILYGAPQDIDSMSPDELVKAVQDTGVVGLGGAAFPTHVKLKIPEGKHVDTVIVNGCECEPYLTTDHRVMLELPDQIYAGIRTVRRALGAEQVIIAVEENKQDAAEVLRAHMPPDLPVRVECLHVKYPQGAEKMLTKALLNREVPSGGLPMDVGVGCFNVATLAQIGELLPRSGGLIERVVTVTGDGIERPGNYLMALGTPLKFILEQVGLKKGAQHVVLGGPMMGGTVASLDMPVTKGVTGILITAEALRNGTSNKVYPCIKCGECASVCPLYLNPSKLGQLARKGLYEKMEAEFHLNDCFECGSCTYVCPSNIPLVQYFRVAKALNRERKAAEAASV
jgi:Na+-translocating ferredoxin:NAD+ oxidoreductase subunit C